MNNEDKKFEEAYRKALAAAGNERDRGVYAKEYKEIFRRSRDHDYAHKIATMAVSLGSATFPSSYPPRYSKP